MGCPAKVTINKPLVFTITTHDSFGGFIVNADALPIFRIYDLSGNLIANGHMARIDADNTTGFYVGAIVASGTNGFAENSFYTLYVEATVSGNAGAVSYEFEVQEIPVYEIDPTDLIAAVKESLKTVEVRPTRTVLGPCKRSVVKICQ